MNSIGLKFINLTKRLETLIVFNNILNDPIVSLLIKILKQSVNNKTDEYNLEVQVASFESLLIKKAEEEGYGGNILNEHILNLISMDENIYTLLCENYNDEINTSLKSAALFDISSIVALICTMPLNYIQTLINKALLSKSYIPVNYKETLNTKFLNNLTKLIGELALFNEISEAAELKIAGELLGNITWHSKNYGCGLIGRYKMFTFSNQLGLIPIENFDPITLNQIIKYEYQKETLINNIRSFIAGFTGNHMLLTGARGTGKSSCVKALANDFFYEGLRLVEITKNQIIDLPVLFNILKRRGKKFIVFIDDLSFDDREVQYKELKSLLEGSSMKIPANVLIFVTSNRRHLIQENWADRTSGSKEAEIHSDDVMNEKISLSDRFEVISFPIPTPEEYLEIVNGIAKGENIDIPSDELKKLSFKWELNKKLSGRTAKRFVDNYIQNNSLHLSTK